MADSRQTYNAGPGVVVIGTPGQTASSFYSKDDIKIAAGFSTIAMQTSGFGSVGNIVDDRKVDVSFTPLPIMANLPVLFPYIQAASHFVGSELFPQNDQYLTIYGFDNTVRSYKASAVTKMPSLHFGMSKQLFGDVTFTCLGAGNKEWNATDVDWTTIFAGVINGSSLSHIGTTTDWATLSTDLNLALWQQTYATASWGAGTPAAPWANFDTIDGFDVDINLNITPKKTDRYGIKNYMISGLDVGCKFAPNAIPESDIDAKFLIQGASAQRGAMLSRLGGGLLGSPLVGQPLIIKEGTAGGTPANQLVCTINGASIEAVEYAYSQTTSRIPNISMVGTRTSFSGALADYITLAIA